EIGSAIYTRILGALLAPSPFLLMIGAILMRTGAGSILEAVWKRTDYTPSVIVMQQPAAEPPPAPIPSTQAVQMPQAPLIDQPAPPPSAQNPESRTI
ncbi:MAG: hypothetical protein AB1665_06695, partial [Candidatus Thermoplasmatota archaeon]